MVRHRTSNGLYPKAAEARISPICRPLFSSSGLLISVAVAAVPARASLEGGQEEALHDYARARLADDAGALDPAVENYKRALAIDPASTVVALRSYRQAIESGDSALALRAAHLLDQNVALPPDGPLLLMSEALQKKDWKKARALSLRLSKMRNFAFRSEEHTSELPSL